MIADFFLNMISSIVEWVGGFLPSLDLAFPSLPMSWLSSANYFVPIGPVLAIAVAVLLLGAPMLLVSLALWVIALVRGGSSRG